MAAGGAAAPVWEWRINGRSGGTTIAPRRVAGGRPAEEGRRGMSRRRGSGLLQTAPARRSGPRRVGVPRPVAARGLASIPFS